MRRYCAAHIGAPLPPSGPAQLRRTRPRACV